MANKTDFSRSLKENHEPQLLFDPDSRCRDQALGKKVRNLGALVQLKFA
jgi:hypothetical protein